MAGYRRTNVGTNGYHVPRCSQAFTSLTGLSRPSLRTQNKVSVSMGVTATMCVTSKPCDLYLVEQEGFPEEKHWIREPSCKIPMCLIRRFVNSCYEGRKCPKYKRKIFVSNQGSIPVHPLHLFGLSGESRRKTQTIK